MTEQENELIEKWNFLLEDFKSNGKKSKFSRIFEKTAQHDTANSNVLIPITCRVFYKLKDIKMSNGAQHKVEVGEYYKEDFFIATGQILHEQLTSYCATMASIVVDIYKEHNKFGYLQILPDNGINKIYYMF